MNCIEIPLVLLCGFVYPVSVLPAPVRAVSYALSPTYAVELLRMSVWGADDITLYCRKMAVLFALTLLYAVFGGVLYKRIDKRVRIKASLEVIG